MTKSEASETLRTFLANRRSSGTRIGYARSLIAFAKYLGASTTSRELSGDVGRTVLRATSAQITAWRDKLLADDLAEATVAANLSAIKSLFRFARSTGVIRDSAAAVVLSPRIHPSRQRTPFVEGDQVRRLLGGPDPATSVGLRDRVLLGLLAGSGLRRKEVATIQLRQIALAPDHAEVTVTGKGDRERTVTVEEETAQFLTELVARRRRDGAGDDAPLFVAAKNPRYHRFDRCILVGSVNKVFDRWVRRTQITAADGTKPAPHSMRRSFATIALDRGVNIRDVQQALGHSDTRMTSRYDRRRKSSVTIKF